MAKENLKVNTAPAEDASTGSAEDVDAIMKKYDRESNTRIWEGKPGISGEKRYIKSKLCTVV